MELLMVPIFNVLGFGRLFDERKIRQTSSQHRPRRSDSVVVSYKQTSTRFRRNWSQTSAIGCRLSKLDFSVLVDLYHTGVKTLQMIVARRWFVEKTQRTNFGYARKHFARPIFASWRHKVYNNLLTVTFPKLTHATCVCRDLSKELTKDKLLALKQKRLANKRNEIQRTGDDDLVEPRRFEAAPGAVAPQDLTKDVLSKERQWRTRTTCMEAMSKVCYSPYEFLNHTYKFKW